MTHPLPPLAEMVLAVLTDRWQAIQRLTPPPKWKKWEVADYQEAVRNGVRWQPKELFNGGTPLSAAEAQRVLRSLALLADRGLVVRVVSESGKLWSVKLTPEGEALAAALLAASPAPADDEKLESIAAVLEASGAEIDALVVKLADQPKGVADAG